MIITLRCRIKDKHRVWLNAQAREVNFVWNYCNELSQRVLKREGRFINAFALQKYTDGASDACSLHSHTIQAIGKECVTRRNQHKKARLNWRKSGGAHRSLGWVPFKAGSVKAKPGQQVFFNGQLLGLWDSYGLGKHTLRAGSFNEDATGRWYLNVQVEVGDGIDENAPATAVGIDLGFKDCAVASNGLREQSRFYAKYEAQLAIAQRAGKKQRVRALHAKIKHARKDALHKFSSELVSSFGAIFIGDVSSLKMVASGRGKSALDAAWGLLKQQLSYKCAYAGRVLVVVDESYSTQTCSCCNKRTGPKGLEGLRIREWACACGAMHDRDINAARNILEAGRGLLEGGIPGL